jgi:hypothetical protein
LAKACPQGWGSGVPPKVPPPNPLEIDGPTKIVIAATDPESENACGGYPLGAGLGWYMYINAKGSLQARVNEPWRLLSTNSTGDLNACKKPVSCIESVSSDVIILYLSGSYDTEQTPLALIEFVPTEPCK